MDATALHRQRRAWRHVPRLLTALLFCALGQRRRGHLLMFRHWLGLRRHDQHPLICSWCEPHRVLRHGNPRLRASHTICLSCRDQFFPRLHRLVSSLN